MPRGVDIGPFVECRTRGEPIERGGDGQADAAERAQSDEVLSGPLYQRALSIRRESMGEDNPLVFEVLPFLGLALLESGRAAEAETLLRRSLETVRAVLSPTEPDLSDTLVALGAVELERGRPKEAEVLAREAIAVLRQAKSAQILRLAHAESVLGASLLAQGERAEAERILLASLETERERSGQRARATARRLVQLYEIAGDRRAADFRDFLARIDAEAAAELARTEAKSSN